MLPANAPTRPDLQLAVMGIALVGGLLAGVFSPIPLSVGGATGSLLAGVAVVDSVALNPPVEE